MYIEKYFEKSENINDADIQNFIEMKIEENLTLEYTRIETFKNRGEVAKMTSGFANTEGGLLCLGIKEDEGKTYPAGTDWGKGNEYLKESLEQIIRDNTDPPVKVTIYPVRKGGGVIFLIYISKSNNLHMVKRQFRFYKRLNTQFQPMTRHEIVNFIKEKIDFEDCALFRFTLEPVLVEWMESLLLRTNPKWKRSDEDSVEIYIENIVKDFEEYYAKLTDLFKFRSRPSLNDIKEYIDISPGCLGKVVGQDSWYFIAGIEDCKKHPNDRSTPEEKVLFNEIRDNLPNIELLIKMCGNIEEDTLNKNFEELRRDIVKFFRLLLPHYKYILNLEKKLLEIKKRYGSFDKTESVKQIY